MWLVVFEKDKAMAGKSEFEEVACRHAGKIFHPALGKLKMTCFLTMSAH